MAIVIHCDVCRRYIKEYSWKQKDEIPKKLLCSECETKVNAFDKFIEEQREQFRIQLKGELGIIFEEAKQNLRQRINELINSK